MNSKQFLQLGGTSFIAVGIMSSIGLFGLGETWSYMIMGISTIVPIFFINHEEGHKFLLSLIAFFSILSLIASEKPLDIGVFLMFSIFFLWVRIKKINQ